MKTKSEILNTLEEYLSNKLFDKFYPLIIDKQNGGFLCNLSSDWQFVDPQDKMIVTQARHTWTPAKAVPFFPGNSKYENAMWHGVKFLKDVMWDDKFGGFYTMRNAEGGLSDYRGYFEEKRTYGNAFAVYALAAVYELTKNPEVLDFAIAAHNWIEEHAYDHVLGGYFQFLTREGKPFSAEDIKNTKASDANEAYYKDQNSSIHLIEAYTELYNVWKDERLKSRLNELLLLIRDTITTEKGYMNLFFTHDWKPVSFRNSSKEEREKNYGLDHVSFGHDYETAFLMLEASYTLGLKDDVRTLQIAKKMVDHAIANGFDEEVGGFYEAGYYFAGEDKCTIINSSKNWWSQAEGLNSLLLMARIFPEEPKYYEHFLKQLDYVDKYFIDHARGGWYEYGLDKNPESVDSLKGNIWKACYHEGRSIMNCIKMLSDEDYPLYKSSPRFAKIKDETEHFLEHWKRVKESELKN
ncbi:MAG: N-acylglucosamine 2-epimerase [Ignavibacteriales bacterium]|nr:MAG: N-acylglucosamine 2-epimerase [Ignavibacteriales bacterium]